MFSSTHLLPDVNKYEQAHKLFTTTPLPKTRNGRWRDNERPLKDSRSWHYRLEKGDGFDHVMLYNTAMARYYEPTPAGRRTMYTAHSSQTSKQFMRHVLATSGRMHWRTTQGTTVMVPLATKDSINDRGRSFSASLWTTPDGLLDTALSAHTPMYTHKMSSEDKATRKQARVNAEPYITLACLRLPEFRERQQIDDEVLEPFKGVDIGFAMRCAIDRITQGVPNIKQEEINAFMLAAERVYDYEATKLAYKYHNEPPEDIAQRVTEKVLADGLWRVMVRCSPFLNRKSEAVPLPQFMAANKFPSTGVSPYGQI